MTCKDEGISTTRERQIPAKYKFNGMSQCEFCAAFKGASGVKADSRVIE